MRQARGYTLKKICNVPYLLPYGQKIAEFRRGVRINETGVFLWNNMASPISRDALFARFVTHFDASGADLPMLSRDFSTFLDALTSLGMIDTTEERWFLIGGISLCITGDPALLSDDFSAFQIDPALNQTAGLSITLSPTNAAPDALFSGNPIITTADLVLRENTDSYRFDFKTMDTLLGAMLTRDGKNAVLSYKDTQHAALLKEQIFHAIRFLFLYRAELSGIYAIHSASILYQGKAWLFSGPSGTGKSTHTALWKKLYDTPVLNGDLNLLAISDEKPVVHGLPWCGTSGISSIKSYPLGGIIFLCQSNNDQVLPLSPDEAALHTLHRLISPIWDEGQLTQCLAFCETLSSLCYTAKLCCTKNDSAAQTMKLAIDERTRRLRNSP